jgi:hypothetical protein
LAEHLVLAAEALQLGGHVLLAIFTRSIDLALATAVDPVAQG